MQILSFQPQISKVFSVTRPNFFLIVGQNNFGDKIPFFEDPNQILSKI